MEYPNWWSLLHSAMHRCMVVKGVIVMRSLLVVMLFILVGIPMDKWTCQLNPVQCVDFGPNYPAFPDPWA